MPDTSYVINDKLISLTQEDYNALGQKLAKFDTKHDKELIYQINEFMKNNLQDKEQKNIDPEKDFNVSDMKWKDAQLKKMQDHVKKTRIQFYWNFNMIFVEIFPYLPASPPKLAKGQQSAFNTSAAALFGQVKHMIMTSVKMKFVDSSIDKLERGSRSGSAIPIKRISAMRYEEEGKQDHTGEFTIYGQVYQYFKKQGNYKSFMLNGTDDMAFSTKFLGEGSMDVGGPYRECLTNMVREMEVGTMPLMIKTANNRNDHGDNRECFMLNPDSKNPTHSELFKFLGVLIGYAFRSKSCMPFNLAPPFWKKLNGEELVEADLKSFDTYSW